MMPTVSFTVYFQWSSYKCESDYHKIEEMLESLRILQYTQVSKSSMISIFTRIKPDPFSVVTGPQKIMKYFFRSPMFLMVHNKRLVCHIHGVRIYQKYFSKGCLLYDVKLSSNN